MRPQGALRRWSAAGSMSAFREKSCAIAVPKCKGSPVEQAPEGAAPKGRISRLTVHHLPS